MLEKCLNLPETYLWVSSWREHQPGSQETSAVVLAFQMSLCSFVPWGPKQTLVESQLSVYSTYKL